MNAYTRQDLSVMQAWPLERKIRVTQAKIIEWYHHYGGKVAVSFSGGKDSTVLLDLARRAFPDIPAVFVDTGLEYPEIREFVKTVPNVTWLRPEMPFSKVISEYGYPVISKDVARRIRYARKGGTWALCHLNGLNRDGTPSKFNERYQKWRVLLDAPFPVSDACCTVIKERPCTDITGEPVESRSLRPWPVRARAARASISKSDATPIISGTPPLSPCLSGQSRMCWPISK